LDHKLWLAGKTMQYFNSSEMTYTVSSGTLNSSIYHTFQLTMTTLNSYINVNITH